MATKFNEALLRLVKDDEEDVLVTEHGELDGLLDKASLPLAESRLLFLGVDDRFCWILSAVSHR